MRVADHCRARQTALAVMLIISLAPSLALANHSNPLLVGGPARPPARPLALAAPAGAHLTYYGGRVVSNMQVVQVLYGTGSYLPQVSSTSSPSMATFYQGVLNSPYVDWLTEYNTNIIAAGGTAGTNQSIGRGSFIAQYAITPSSANNHSTIDDSNIQSELAAQIQAGNLPPPTSDAAGNTNTYYAVFFPHGKTIMLSGSRSCVAGGFCAYHGTIAAVPGRGEVYYGVHPDMQSGSGCETGCGSAAAAFGNYTSVASHEMVETITDCEVGIASIFAPPLAWYDDVNGEIGDICNAQQGTIVGGDGVSYTVQKEFSNLANNCIISIGVSPTPTGTPNFTNTQTGTPTATRTGTGTPTNTRTPTPTATLTPTAANTATRTPTATSTGTATPTNTQSPTLTLTPTAANTATQTPTVTSTGTATPTNTQPPTVTLTPTAANTATRTPTVTSTGTATPTNTQSPTLTLTPTAANTATQTPTVTSTGTATPTNTQSPTLTLTPTAANTATRTPTVTSTGTATPTNTQSPTLTLTPTAANTATQTPTATSTGTATPTNTQSPTLTLTPTAANTATQTPTATSTGTATPTNTQSPTLTQTPTAANTATRTPTVTSTGTATATGSATRTRTATTTSSPPLTATATITATKTGTPTPAPTYQVDGTISYYRSALAVSGVSIAVPGSALPPTTTDVDGRYTVPAVTGGNWQVAPRKTGDRGAAISALDAAYVLEALAGHRQLDPQQTLAADVTGDGIVNELDVQRILQYEVGILPQLPAAQLCASDWLFVPAPVPPAAPIAPSLTGNTCQPGALAFPPLVSDATGEDFQAILIGDVTGNWQQAP